MYKTISGRIKLVNSKNIDECYGKIINLTKAKINREYTIKEVKTGDEEIKNFLFTLGCYNGEKITVLSVLSENYVISLKEARYSVDRDLAETIIV